MLSLAHNNSNQCLLSSHNNRTERTFVDHLLRDRLFINRSLIDRWISSSVFSVFHILQTNLAKSFAVRKCVFTLICGSYLAFGLTNHSLSEQWVKSLRFGPSVRINTTSAYICSTHSSQTVRQWTSRRGRTHTFSRFLRPTVWAKLDSNKAHNEQIISWSHCQCSTGANTARVATR